MSSTKFEVLFLLVAHPALWGPFCPTAPINFLTSLLPAFLWDGWSSLSVCLSFSPSLCGASRTDMSSKRLVVPAFLVALHELMLVPGGLGCANGGSTAVH